MIGNNSYIGPGCLLEKSLVLGNDYYTNEKTRAASLEKGESALGIGMCQTCLHNTSFCRVELAKRYCRKWTIV